MALDTYYRIHAVGGTAASLTSASGKLLGDYAGLSSLNDDDVVQIQVALSAGDLRIFDTLRLAESASKFGIRINAAASLTELKAMRAADASMLGYTTVTGGADTSAIWTIWKRVP